MRIATLSVTAAAIAVGGIALATKSNPISGVLFFLPFSLGPLFVTLAIAFLCRSAFSQWLLLASSIAYMGWFSYIYLWAFHWHLDPQSPIALMFVGFYSLPVMLPVWIVAIFRRKAQAVPD